MTLLLFILLAVSDNDALKQFRDFLKDSSETINTSRRIQVTIEFDLPIAPQRAAGKLKISVTRFDSCLKISGIRDAGQIHVESDGKRILSRYLETKEYFSVASGGRLPDQLIKFFEDWGLFDIDLRETLESVKQIVSDELDKTNLARQTVSPGSHDTVFAKGATQLKLTRIGNTRGMALLKNNKAIVAINYQRLEEKDLGALRQAIDQIINSYETNPPQGAVKIDYSKGDTFLSLLRKISATDIDSKLIAIADLTHQKRVLKVAIPSKTFIIRYGSDMKISLYLGCFNVEFKEGGKNYCIIQWIEPTVSEQAIRNWIVKERTTPKARIVQVKDPGVNKLYSYVFLKKGNCLIIPDVEINEKIVDVITEEFGKE